MVEQVEEVRHGRVFFAQAHQHVFRIDRGHRGERRAQPHKLHRHLQLPGQQPLQVVQLAGGERQRRQRGEAQGLFARLGEVPHRSAARLHPLHQPHRLEEPHTERLVLEQLPQRGEVRRVAPERDARLYSSTLLPARGGHVRNTSFLRLVRTVSWEKLFMDA